MNELFLPTGRTRTRLRPSTAPRWLRHWALLIAMLFTWSLTLAPQALANQPPQPAMHQPPKPHDDPAWHTVDYHAASSVPVANSPAVLPPSLTLLDEVGRLERAVSPAEVHGWKQQLAAHHLTPARASKLHLWLGEYLLAHDQQPEQAIEQFALVQKLGKPADHDYDLPAYDTATALFYEGAYWQAADAFQHLLTEKNVRHGFDRRTCALWARHAGACAGYHLERAKMGIPEPPRLDPLCGAAGLAECLRAQHMPSDKKRVLSACRVTGEGSTLLDVLHAAKKLGMSARAVTADDAGLMALPKPLIAYVEHDHFISVIKAGKQGVSYLCSDCGPWPGGQVDLSWKQWHALNPGLYAIICKPGSTIETQLSQLASRTASAENPVQLAARMLSGLHLHAFARRSGLSSLHGHVVLYNPYLLGPGCGTKPESQHCPPFIQCPHDGGGHPCHGASAGDPVNLATGEEEYTPEPDLTIYNPIGPSVNWSRLYNSLRGPNSLGYEATDFGVGWSQTYNLGVALSGTSRYLIFPNGARVQITASSTPSASNPKVVCTVPGGTPLYIEWDFNTNTNQDYYKVTLPSRAQWTLIPTGSGWYELQTIADRNGNTINFNYIVPLHQPNPIPLLSTITDSNGKALLTVTRTSYAITSVSDCYGRSIYYHIGSYTSNTTTWQEVDHVSQIVATGTANPPDRYAYGYQNVNNGMGTEQVPFLSSITVPSPTGTGNATATINYTPGTDYVSSIVDANGNTHTYTIVDQTHTKVAITDAHSNLVYSYTVGFDSNMDKTTVTDGSNSTLVLSKTYSDPNDPYRPSEVQDGNGYAVNGAGGKGTWNYSWDQFGNLQSYITPRNVTTTFTWSYANFALGELTKVQQGSKSPTSISYYEPSGLPSSITLPQPGTSGGTQTVSISATYSSLGNLLTMKTPGNNATIVNGVDQGITTTFNYTTDGSYSQPEALGEPITITDNLGKVTHLRFYNHQINSSDPLANTGMLKSVTDALGNETDVSDNLANQTQQVTFPATGQTGTGRSYRYNSYLYSGGPLTQTALYDESGNQVRSLTPSYGPESELLGESGSLNSISVVYDGAYRISQLSDGNSHSTQYQFNTTGYLSQITYPNSDTLQATSWDKDGNVLSATDGLGVAHNFVYNDNESRLTDAQYPATPSLNVHVDYDSYGRILDDTDSTGSKSFAFDDDDLTTSVTTTYTGLPAQTLDYSFYPNASLQTLTTPAGSFSYSYNGRGDMTGLSNPYGKSFAWTWLDNGWLWGQQVGTAATTAYTYNALGQLTDLTTRLNSNNNILTEFGSLKHDGAGDLTQLTATVSAHSAYSGTTTYGFDTKSQLTSESSTRAGSYSEAFGYDLAGNPTTFKGAGQTFNSDNQNTASSHDGDGNPTAWQGNTLSFDANDKLTAIGSVLTAGYDASGLRAWKQSSSGTTYFLYAGSVPVCELNSSGSVTAVNTWGVNGLVSRHTVSSNSNTFYTFDEQGSVAQRLNGSGSVLGSYCFDSYGTRQSTDNSTDPYSGYGAQWGYYRDSETGLSLLGERYYDPGQGRFLNRDPIRYRGGINLYGYAGNNPLVWIDPKGLEEIPPEDNEEIITPEEEPQIAYGIDEPENSPAQPPKSGSINCPDLGSAGGVDFSGAPSSSDFGSGGDSPDYDAVPIYVDPNKYPASAQHIIDAQAAGHPNFLTINRGGAAANRAASLSGIKTAPGMDRDEYPPAVFKEGGPGADVRLIPSGDNRGSGASFGGQIRNLPDDTIIQIIPQAPPLP